MERRRVALAGVTTALVGFASSSAVVLAGLQAAGASPAQAASGLVALCLTQALGMLWLAQRTKLPVVLAWSTPGAALLAAGTAPDGGWPAAVGAFAIAGVLIVLTGLWPALARAVGAIPATIAQAMLAGVLVALCLAPVRALVDQPLDILPIVLVWLVLIRFAPTWASPAAFAVGLIVLGVEAALHGGVNGPLLPALEPVVPSFTWQAAVGIALPLYVVTMASQNVPGSAVLASYGYRVPWRESMVVTGVGTLAGAPFGGHAINLAAITAALAASPDTHPDPSQRWRAVRVSALLYLVLAALSTALTTLVGVAPGVLAAVAGLALLPTLASSLRAAMAEEGGRIPPVITFVVAASGISVLGVGAAFWALLAGLVAHVLLRRR
ncbi:benzoate/H(+) symporter BenE family transporter [Microbacterium paludicola]|uniref:Benzoate/H(+) symporter BenE family transporter n=1 Tax=Microbacterium paludicola TaxID=300019 RepID=A0A4Y9FTZ1_9MICO|nr:benzoate/H(+) symporter BenE family transporter [Microbacterium paludicola]MBF0817325.1 benzoate/H(+) symporter BenE family transporter [Microbacterium paludicola]TFU31699.1 benzoate/H(+) symporter BenE family transporter [Microbacterium paludicola]